MPLFDALSQNPHWWVRCHVDTTPRSAVSATHRPIAAYNLPTTNVKHLASQSWIVVKTLAIRRAHLGRDQCGHRDCRCGGGRDEPDIAGKGTVVLIENYRLFTGPSVSPAHSMRESPGRQVVPIASNHVRERGEARLIEIPRPPTKPAEVKQKIHHGGPILRPNTAIAPGSGGRTVAI